MAPPLLHEHAMAKRRRSEKKPHDTPVLGPRGRVQKVKPLPPSAPHGGRYHPGAKPPERDPWQDSGRPETNG